MRWAVGLVVIALLGLSLPAGATPVCADEPRTPCGDRIFPEADTTTAFVQHDMGEYEDGIKALAAEFPRFVKVRSFSELLDQDTLSAGGRDLWMVEITDFEAPESDKVAVAASLSVHGPERAGLEGGVRFMEDLARWAADEPDHLVMNGTDDDSIQLPVSEALKKVHYYFADINPDGWSDGDLANGGVFMRGNGNGADLNRQFPTIGWTKTNRALPLTEPEPKAWVKLIRAIHPVVTTDIHGELNSAQNAFADMMYPAGQWNVVEQAQQEQAARHMQSNVARLFAEDGVVIGDATGVAGMKPAEYATGFDVVGYDDSGFMGDWFTQEVGALDMDVEHFLSHMAPNSTWSAPLEKAHIAAVRGELESLMVEAIAMSDVNPHLDVGKVGYLYDPKVITDADGYGGPKPPKGHSPKHYRSTRMRYFDDLSTRTIVPLRKVWSNQIYKGGLNGLDSFVIADRPYPRTQAGKKPDSVRMAKALEAFVKDGGNLVLTDRGVRFLKKLGVAPKSAISKRLYGAGHINIDDLEDPYTKDVHSTASQTYYEVGLGYSVDEDSSPHWVVTREAWEGAGGVVVAHVEADTDVGLGRLELGKGTIGIIGALLPPATEKFDHLYGLADYAVTVAGGQIFANMLATGR
ncbi:MAG: hypothetical protein QOG04_1135 [Actinomycetota bacterium]|jgi:hypothetical protein|nr:hypothetical protein [Actinomycetota bacterium]